MSKFMRCSSEIGAYFRYSASPLGIMRSSSALPGLALAGPAAHVEIRNRLINRCVEDGEKTPL